jgi:hypothetical protein
MLCDSEILPDSSEGNFLPMRKKSGFRGPDSLRGFLQPVQGNIPFLNSLSDQFGRTLYERLILADQEDIRPRRKGAGRSLRHTPMCGNSAHLQVIGENKTAEAEFVSQQ